MKNASEHEYTTYPRMFNAYRWYKPLLVGALYVLFIVFGLLITDLITKLFFGNVASSVGYDDMDLFTTAGAFSNGATAAIVIPCLLLAAIIVKDRPISSYFSSMGGWRWKVFFKTLAVFIVIFAIPSAIFFALKGRTSDIRFTLGGLITIILMIPLQSIGEELSYRSFLMQTVSSWFRIPVAGLIVQIILFTIVHPYNIIGIIGIAVSALNYGLICILTRGLEAPSALHILNNMTEILMVGFGFGSLTGEQTVPSMLFNLTLKILCFLFLLYADKKLHWFDEVRYDDVERFNARTKK